MCGRTAIRQRCQCGGFGGAELFLAVKKGEGGKLGLIQRKQDSEEGKQR